MWLKLCLLLIYITVLFVLARILEAVAWYETGTLSRRLLDPMALSVAKLKALLEQRGVSYDTVVEKSELSQLVEGSGPVHEDEVELLQASDDSPASANTNFTSGAHFYEQVEDAKDSVWLVQVVAGYHIGHNHIIPTPLSDNTWKAIRKKVTKFGVHTGVLDCRLDPRWCERRGWHSSHLLLALPQVYQQKANVATHTYVGPLRQHAICHWIRQKLHEKIETIHDFKQFKDEWLNFKNVWQEPEVRAVLFTKQDSIPMFFSALSVKFPGRVRFGVVEETNKRVREWTQALDLKTNLTLPQFLIITNEGTYVYGKNFGECYTFSSMETFLKFLHPCLNDIFITSFLVANVVSVFEAFVTQGSLGRRLRRFLWCLVKYNAAVIMLWLPLIALFQLPYLSNIPLLGLKSTRLLTTSSLGAAFRRDFFYCSQHPYFLAASFLSACTIFGIIAYWWTGGRYEEDHEPWFNFTQMRTLTHLRPNEFFEPMLMSGYEFSGGMEIFGSRLSVPTMSLQPVVSTHYIGLLPTWQYHAAQFYRECSDEKPTPQMSCLQCSDSGFVNSAQGSADGPEASSECDTGNSSCLCCASASDLLDGNYHCECRVHLREQDHDRPCVRPPSQSQGPSPLHSDSSPSFMPCSCCRKEASDSGSGISSVCSECPDKSSSVPSCLRCKQAVSKSDSRTETTSEPHLASEFPEGYLACTSCVICLEEFTSGTHLCGLPCGHVFHHKCILTWLNRDHHFCPVCRWPSFQPRLQNLTQQSSHIHDE
ncbi:hypothetical protein BaRGS_00013809 [Batillaria attramentaria]|uniref:RING-type domain-containing protein n=1 Tax=Batillaria attramentaria TaxID=370345 RepID=A0ABD0L6I0_9CAEN